MKIFAGTISVKEKIETPELDFDILQTGEKSYFIMWADEKIKSSSWITNMLEELFWELETSDISIEWEDDLEILASEYEQGVYECVCFEWPELEFETVLERFADSEAVIAIRSAWVSKLYWNAIIKADFIY